MPPIQLFINYKVLSLIFPMIEKVDRDNCLTSEYGTVKLMFTSEDVLNSLPSPTHMKNVSFLNWSVANIT